MSLGLEDRSARLLSGREVWPEIKALLSGYNDVQAAIAFVGADADAYLPLRGPATIVVNAGEEALRNGWTDPAVLLRWTRRGVRVHTLSTLHAKLLVAQGNPSFVLVGSADVLSTSGRALEEAILLADEKDTVDEVRRAVDRWRRLAGEPLTDAWLQAAAQRYRPPGSIASAPVAPPAVEVPAPVESAAAARPDGPTPAPAVPVPAAPTAVDVVVGVGDAAAEVPDVAPEESAAEVAVDPEVLTDDGPVSVQHTGSTAEVPTDVAVPAEAGATEPAAEAAGTPVDTGAPGAPAEPVLPPVWPRPKFIYLATLTRDGRASESAQEQLETLREEHRVLGSGAEPVLDVEMFWWEPATRSAAKTTTYREGWHIVPISVPASGRPAVLSPVHSPGRVLHSFTEYSGGPARTYYYLLIHQQGAPTTFRKLREALTAVGEKPSYDHAYMMQHKVAAILDLWPTVHYAG